MAVEVINTLFFLCALLVETVIVTDPYRMVLLSAQRAVQLIRTLWVSQRVHRRDVGSYGSCQEP
jgi:hypothetical protein